MLDDNLDMVDNSELQGLEDIDITLEDSLETAETEEPLIAPRAMFASVGADGDDKEEDTKGVPTEAPYVNGQNENVDLQQGNLRYTVTDFIIPGRNGFDLKIARQYNSCDSNIKRLYLRHYTYFDKDKNKTFVVENKDNDNDYYTQMYGLSHGWQFVLPSMEIRRNSEKQTATEPTQIGDDTEQLLHLDDGRTYNIFDSEELFKRKDVVLFNKSGQIAHPRKISETRKYNFFVSYKNGNKDYFVDIDENDKFELVYFRKLVAREDRFGNCIFFDLQDDGGMTIIDSWGRTIKLVATSSGFKWKAFSVTGVVDEDLTKQINVEYILENIEYKINGQQDKRISLMSLTKVIDQERRVTNYEYYVKAGEAAYASTNYTKHCFPVSIPSLLLTNITYPTSAKTQYEYDMYQINTNIIQGIYPHFPLTLRRDIIDGNTCNLITYVCHTSDAVTIKENNYPIISDLMVLFSKDDTKINDYIQNLTQEKLWEEFVKTNGFNNIVAATAVHRQRIQTTEVEKKQNNITETYNFNKRYLLNDSTIKQNSRLIEKINYTYGRIDTAYRLPTNQTTERFNPNHKSEYIKKTASFQYDSSGKANITEISESYENDNLDDKVTTFTYTTNYSDIKEKVYEKVDTATIKEEYIYKSDGRYNERVPKYKKIYERKNKSESYILKEKTEYDYDSDTRFRLTNVKRYYSKNGEALDNSNSYYQTLYTYNDSAYYDLPKTVSITGVMDADGNSVGDIKKTYEYDICGRITSETIDGKKTTYAYDSLGRKTKITYPSVNGAKPSTKTFVYDDTKNCITVTDEKGFKTRYEYTPFGKIKKVYLAVNDTPDYTKDVLTVEYVYDTNERVTEEKVYDGRGSAEANVKRKTLYTYDYLDRVESKIIQTRNGQKLYYEAYEYTDVCANPDDSSKKCSRIKKTIVGDGTNAATVVSNTYADQLGRVIKECLGADSAIAYEYDKLGNRIKQTDANKNKTLWSYDYADRVTETTNDKGFKATNKYDALGNLEYATDFKGQTTEYVYNSAGQLVKQVSPFDSRNATTKYYYDSAGNLTSQKTYQGDYWLETHHIYDERDRLTDTYQYTGNTTGIKWVRTSHIYDEVGNKLEVHTGYTDLSNQCRKTKYTYDRFGNITSISDPMGKSEQYSYNNIGLLEYKTDRNGNKTTYQYDEIDRLTKLSVIVDNSNSSEKEYTYTLTGQKLVEISREVESGNTNILQTKYTYNEKGWLAKQTDPDGVTKEYSYDLNGNRKAFKLFKTSATSPEINLYYVYDSLNRLITVKKDGENGTTIAEYTYDDNGNRSKLKYPQSSIEATYSYNKANLATSMENKRSGSLITGCDYTYYLDGNISAKTDKTPTKSVTTTYQYDRLGQLVEESVSGSNKTAYEYDQYLNRSKKTVSGVGSGVTTYEYNENNWLLKETKKHGNITEAFSYGYDLNGNQCYREWDKIVKITETPEPGRMSFKDKEDEDAIIEWRDYNGFNQLTKVNRPPLCVSYCYRPDGFRHSKSVSNPFSGTSKTTVHHWDGQHIVQETVDGKVQNKYLRGINLIALQEGSDLSYYLFNLHGDVVRLTDKSGTVVKEYDYDAFGNQQGNGKDKEDINPFRYCEEYWDAEAGTVYLRNRYYNPRIGRFASEDQARSGLNWYTYCENNPVNRVDPWGLDSYVFYDPNDSGFKTYVTKEKAELLAKEMKDFYGTDVHVIAIATGTYTIDGNDVSMTAAEYFEYQWNLMGSLGTGTIEGVGLYFHGRSDGQGIGFKREGGGENEYEKAFKREHINNLDVKSMDTLFLFSCNQAKGQNNFASTITDRMNLNYTIASDGQTMMTDVFGTAHYTTTLDPYGFVVYKKHYPSESDVFWQSGPEVTKSQLNRDHIITNYTGFTSIMKAAGVPKP